MHYTRQQIDDMKDKCDLVELARWCGYTPIRKGNTYSLKEHDSVRIFNHRTFTRYSANVGGDAIVFLQHFTGCDWQEAVEKLCEFTGSVSERGERPPVHFDSVREKVKFELPEPETNYKRLYAYLIKSRKIDKTIVDYCVKNHLIYESAGHHNVVFLSKDKNGVVHHAFMRGTNEYVPFKLDVEGNNKDYGFNIPGSIPKLKVFESAIDALSEWTLTKDSSVHRLALGGVYEGPLITYLSEHPDISQIDLCLDGDKPGIKAAENLQKEYADKGYIVQITPPQFPEGKDGKDYNDLCRCMSATAPRQSVKSHACR